MKTPDLFDGIFDNRARTRSTNDESSVWKEMRMPWGTYPDLPANAGKAAA